MLKALAILFALFGIYSLYVVVSGHGYLYTIGAILALVAAFGLWFRKRWSQYVVYFFSAAYIIEWLWLLWQVRYVKQWHYQSLSESVLALVPGLLLVTLMLGFSFIAYRGFREQS